METLTKRLREVVAKVPGPRGTSVKIIEKPGKPLMSGLRSIPDPIHCYKGNCPIESQGLACNFECGKENILYEEVCRRCRDSQIDAGILPDETTDYVYIGETSRTLAVRSGQHRDDYMKYHRKEEHEEGTSFMWDHQKEVH